MWKRVLSELNFFLSVVCTVFFWSCWWIFFAITRIWQYIWKCLSPGVIEIKMKNFYHMCKITSFAYFFSKLTTLMSRYLIDPLLFNTHHPIRMHKTRTFLCYNNFVIVLEVLLGSCNKYDDHTWANLYCQLEICHLRKICIFIETKVQPFLLLFYVQNSLHPFHKKSYNLR